MSNLRQYQTYYGVHLVHHSESWGGETYNKLLVKEFPNEYISTTSYTMGAISTFIYPTLVMNKYYLDGVASGHVTLYNDDSTTSYTITNYIVTLYKTGDMPGDKTTIGSVSNTISSENVVWKEDYLTLPVYMNIDKKLVEEDEKLLLELEHDGNTTHVGWAHANDRNVVDMQIKIPFAPTS